MRYQDIPEDQRALTFPTSFLVKAIGLAEHNVREVLLSVLEHHKTEYAVHSITETGSKNGTYASVTVSITARSRKQLDDLYEGLAAHPEIVMTL